MPPASVKTGTEEKTKSRVVPALNLTSEQQKALKSLLFAANKDPELKGYVWPKKRGIEGRQAIVRDENVVGFASPRPSHTGEDVIRVGAIYVDPVHRGQGLASEAIRQIVKGKSGRAFIATDNEASRRAFEAAGFKPTQHETRWGGGDWFSKTSARPTSDRLAEKIAKGKASNCGLFIRIPSDLGKEFPKKEEDDSPPHVTLCYIGELNRAEITKATKAAREVLSDIAPFHVEMTDYGEFENPEGKTIAHMIPRAPELEPLHRRLGRALKDVGIEASRLGQPLKPHASLAYVEEGRKYDGPRPSGKWKVSEVEFWAGTDRSKIPLEGKSNSANNLVEKIAAMKLAAAGITGGPAPKQAPQAPQVQPSRKPIWPKARQQQQISPTPEALVRTSSKPSTRTKMTRKPITPLKDPIGEKQRALFPAKMLEDIPSKETGWRWRPDPRPPPLRSMTFTPSDWERRKQHLEDLRKDRVRTGLEREKRPPPTPRPIMTFTPAEWERRKNQLEAIRKERERLWRLPSRGPQFDPFDPDSGRAIGTGGPAKTAQEKSAAAGISGGPAPKQAPQPPAPTPLRKPIWPKARQTTVQRLSDVPSEAAGWRKAKPAPARPAIEERRDYMGETPAELQWERSRLEMLPFERELPPALGRQVPEPKRRSIFEPVPAPKPKTAGVDAALVEKISKQLGKSDDKPTFMIDLVRRRQGMRSKSPGAVVQRLARELAKQQS
jgi:2'-5' RNA ligase/GNAT superfamily N-acetyltransferase